MENKTEKSIYQKITKIKKLLNEEVKRTGRNETDNFEYYELEDILPKLNMMLEEAGILDIYEVEEKTNKLCLTDGKEQIRVSYPFVYAGKETIQDYGASLTYNKRYTYIMFFNLAATDNIDNANRKKQMTKEEQEQEEKEILTLKRKIRNEIKDFRPDKANEEMKKLGVSNKSTKSELEKVLAKMLGEKNDK